MTDPYRFARCLMARHVLRRSRHVTAVSPDLERDLRTWTPATIEVVPNPLSGPVMQAAPCPSQVFDSKTLVMVLNGWVRLKNGRRALQAFALARRADPALRLLCLGADFQEGGPAHRWAEVQGLAGGVRFVGPLPQAELVQHLRGSLALLHPSLLEACSMAIAEAMAVGLPVIAGAKTAGVAWQLDGGQAGVLADVRDPAAMAEAIARLAGDRVRWQALSRAAYTRARDLFAVDAVIDRYLAMYGELLRARTDCTGRAGASGTSGADAMSAPGRPEGEYRSARREGAPVRVPRPPAQIMGLPVSLDTPSEVLARMGEVIARREPGHFISITNTETMYQGLRAEWLHRYIRQADFSLCDGVGVVVAGWSWGHRVERLTGPNLQLAASDHGRAHGWRHFFYGGKPGVPEEMARRLQQRYPGLEVCGTYSPPFRVLSAEEDERVVQMINDTRPDIVWVGLSLPKQERWIQEHLHRVKAPWMVGVGAAFDYHSGAVPWAPPWARRIGAEWIFRLLREPKLRGPRYWRSFVFVLESAWHGFWRFLKPRRRSA